MLRLLKKLQRNERGNVLLLTAAAFPLIVGSAGLAVDTIQWALWKRQLQRAADSAALAGVYAQVQANATQTATQAVDYELNIPATANLRRNASGFVLTAANRTVSFPAGLNWQNPVRVELQVSQVPAFSSMFMPSIQISAGATAATIRTGVYCVVALVNTGATGITATGNGDINLGCGMITNSTSLTAAIATGSSDVYATPVAAVGAVPASDNWNGAELLPFTVQQDDPYALLGIPSFTSGECTDMNVGSNETVNFTPTEGSTVTCFTRLRVQGNLTLGSGTYVIDGGDVNVNSGARLSCTGCTIILTNSDSGPSPTIGTVDLNGGAQINMTAPTTGTYRDVLFYQDRRATTSNSAVNKINGNSSSTFSGAMYFPKQHLQVNGNAGLSFTCAEFVSWTVEFSGNSGVTNSCPGGFGDNPIMGRHVRLVA
jgi:Flp pilus assembly protein TadG